MRRWLAILFMLFLPLQFSWAAVIAYCQHETGAASAHVGHHEHRHQGHKPDSGSKALPDLDCGYCLAACPTLPSGVASMSAGVSTLAMALAPPPWPASVHPDEPERPKWARPA